MLQRVVYVLMAAAIVAVSVAPASATILFSETFATDAADTATTLSTYPAFTLGGSPGADATVSGGVLSLTNLDVGGAINTMTVAGYAGNILIEANIGADTLGADIGSSNIGVVIGYDTFVFHPGYPGGASRMEGWDTTGNASLGFDPLADGTLYNVKIAIDATALTAAISVTDGVTTYSNTFDVSLGYTPGSSEIGLRWFDAFGGEGHGSVGKMGDLTISNVPEPSTLALTVCGLVGLVAYAWRKRK
jgi:hypothetical protein